MDDYANNNNDYYNLVNGNQSQLSAEYVNAHMNNHQKPVIPKHKTNYTKLKRELVESIPGL